MHWLWRGALDLLFPPRCLVCRDFGPQVICETCRKAIRRIAPPQCAICGLPFDPQAKAGQTCAECGEASHPFAPRALARQVEVLFENRQVTASGAVIADEFAPLQAHVYRAQRKG